MTAGTGSSCAAASGSAVDRRAMRRSPERALVALSLAICVCCSNTDFRARPAEPDAAAGSGGRAGSGGNAGVGGVDAGAGRAGTAGRDAGADGSAGQGGCPTTCPAGEYCNTGNNRCVSCSDVSRFQFAAPQPIVPSTTSSRRFPRAADVDGQLFFRAGNELSEQNVFFTTNVADGGAPELLSAVVNVAGESTSGPLLVTHADGTAPNFYFDRTTDGPGTPRRLFQGRRTARGAVDSVAPMPAPFNQAPGQAAQDHSIAIASAAGRAWWMSTRSSGDHLLTAPLNAAADFDPPVVDFTLGQGTCRRVGLEPSPWASPDGAFLLFAALELTSACLPVMGAPRDVYIGVMQQDGQAAAAARVLDDVSRPNRDETDASMSRDLCWLYFAANESTSPSGFRLYAAPRR